MLLRKIKEVKKDIILVQIISVVVLLLLYMYVNVDYLLFHSKHV